MTRVPRRSPSVVFGLTLYNNPRHLREALESLLGQTDSDLAIVMLDDGNSPESEATARELEARDERVRYFRHESRRGMIATWKEAAEIAHREHPQARYFAWASDHDRWHPRWLETLRREMDANPALVLSYPVTQRIDPTGSVLGKGPRYFETAGTSDLDARWRHFCRAGVGAGDMVYGLIRFDALRRVGIFRPVLRPDRLLMAELTLQGEFKQIDEVLWFRRQSQSTSIARQRESLFPAGQEPKGFGLPPWWQHAALLRREYLQSATPPLQLDRRRVQRMLVRYQLTYGWRHMRKTETSHRIGRIVDNAIWIKKIVKRTWHHAVYHTLVGSRMLWGRLRRIGRRILYEALMLTHRTGLRRSSDTGRGR